MDGEPTTIIEFEATGMTFMPTWEGLSHMMTALDISPDNPMPVALSHVTGNPHNPNSMALIAVGADSWVYHTVVWENDDIEDNGWWRQYQLGWVPDDMCVEVHDMWFGPGTDPEPRSRSSAHVIEFDAERKPRPLVRIILAL